MYTTHLNYLVTQQHAEEAHRAAERDRLARSVVRERSPRGGSRWLARMVPAFISRRQSAISDSMWEQRLEEHGAVIR